MRLPSWAYMPLLIAKSLLSRTYVQLYVWWHRVSCGPHIVPPGGRAG